MYKDHRFTLVYFIIYRRIGASLKLLRLNFVFTLSLHVTIKSPVKEPTFGRRKPKPE